MCTASFALDCSARRTVTVNVALYVSWFYCSTDVALSKNTPRNSNFTINLALMENSGVRRKTWI